MSEPTFPFEAEITLLQRHQWIKRRTEPRYQCGPATSGRVVEEEGSPGRRTWVQNLSASGVGLLLGEALEPGACVVVQLRAVNGHHYHLPARVIHSTEQLTGQYLIGCEFAQRLTADDLDALL